MGGIGAGAVALAGSVALNTITGHTHARMMNSQVHVLAPAYDFLSTTAGAVASGQTVRIATGAQAGDVYRYVGPGGTLPLSPAAFVNNPNWILVTSDALIRATDAAEIFAVAGSLALGIAKGGATGNATAISAGVAVASNSIHTATEALVESCQPITWSDEARGGLTIQASSSGTIKAFTLAGAFSAALANAGTGTAVAAPVRDRSTKSWPIRRRRCVGARSWRQTP